jgi:hypothetical protein
MALFVPPLAAWLRSHHGVISRTQLMVLGVSPAALKRMLATGELLQIYEGVYRHAIWPDTLLSRCAAICAADPRLTICCGGAIRIWQFRQGSGLSVHATTTATSVPIDDGTTIHRCPVMPTGHVHERSDGIRVTSPARTMFDIAKHVGPTVLESMIEQGLRRSQFDIPTLYGVGRLLCRQGRAGSTTFADVLTSRPTWRRPADSHPEIALRNALLDRGIALETQVPLVLADGRTIHPDLGDPVSRFFVEVDDHEWHGGRLAASYDAHRDRQARLVGARVERVSTDEIVPLQRGLIADLVAAYHQHRASSLAGG